jgi:cell wall assembly regulator SMI1
MSRFKIDENLRRLMLRHLAETDLKVDEAFTEKGKADYRKLLEMAFASYDEDWLAEQFTIGGRLNEERFGSPEELRAKARALAIEAFEMFLIVAVVDQMFEEGIISLNSPKKERDAFIFDPERDEKTHFLKVLNPPEPYRTWLSSWCDVLLACRRWGGNVYPPLVIERPAKEKDVRRVENHLGLRLPQSLRETFLHFSAGFEFGWSLYKKAIPPLEGVYRGYLRIGLSDLLTLQTTWQDWIKYVFSDPDDPYCAVWHNKLPLTDVGDGDMIAIDLNNPDGHVIYLSHDDESLHGMVLGNNFVDFMTHWSRLGCVGPEGWILEYFVEDVDGIDSLGKNADKWLRWLHSTDSPPPAGP